ncbi:GMC family oxidoreductase [Aspergillus undulatus]|uniref:GMC family oxidoreductase n=1 Tax=Aspergillus undulatus TaxID=1810928 RepID=UPI003CCD0656
MSLYCFLILFLVSNVLCETFDYVVVGGGTSGLTLAVRLAQSHTVTLVEAGGRYEITYSLAKTPAFDVVPVGSNLATRSPADWDFITTPQAGANGRRVHFSRGKCLGGSHVLPFITFRSPTRQSLDLWAVVVNDSSYAFHNIFPYYQRTTAFTPPNTAERFPNATAMYNASAFDPAGGPLQVSYPNYAMPFSTWVARGMEGIGMSEAPDFNSGEILGYQFCPTTISPNDQRRSSSESSFLMEPVANLTILKETLVKRILFDEQRNAIGVELRGFRRVMASNEVILSAGAFQSPQLLMVSGIGPREHLESHNIPVLSNLPGVGQGMLDHPFFGPSYRVGVETLTRVATNPVVIAEEYTRWLTKARGILTNNVADFLAFEKIPEDLRSGFSEGTRYNLSLFPADWPEVEYMSGAGFIGNISNLLLDQPNDGFQYGSILGVLIGTTSEGTITLASSDASDPPIINPNWLTTESDQQLAVALFKRLRQAFASDQMRPIVIGEEYFPGPQVQTDEEILYWVRSNIMTLWHPARTCKMGTADDPMAVVDSRARVFGVKRLRVVDASALPFLPPGHPQSTCYMLGEKIADDILYRGDASRAQLPKLDL